MEITTDAQAAFVQFAEEKGQQAVSVIDLAGRMLTPAAHKELVCGINEMQDQKLSPDDINRAVIHYLTLGFTCMIRAENDWAPLNESHFKRLESFAHAVARVYPLILVEEGWGSSWDFTIIARGGIPTFVATIAGYSLETDEASIDPYDPNFDEQGLIELDRHLNPRTEIFDDPRTRVRFLMTMLPHMPDLHDEPGAHQAYEARIAQILDVATTGDEIVIRGWRKHLAEQDQAA